MPPKQDWEKYTKPDAETKEEDKIVPLDEGDIQLLRTYGQGPYTGCLLYTSDAADEHRDV